MDSFHVNNVKAEKAKAMLIFERWLICSTVSRFAWFRLTLLVLDWPPYRLQNLRPVLLGAMYGTREPRFIFLVGNAIILTLCPSIQTRFCLSLMFLKYIFLLYEQKVSTSILRDLKNDNATE
ncbi:hypothetical protein NE237_027603 [Protea cynaroides]|uniref:Transmembrane protein n=1 Tax=Protea cynaroides TaxID=273540 RepID=A0A9Q0GPM7_9MAGN|nr:hypothetical protein NE237_027603 [Protea cynaroides]